MSKAYTTRLLAPGPEAASDKKLRLRIRRAASLCYCDHRNGTTICRFMKNHVQQAHTDLAVGLAMGLPIVTYFSHFALRGFGEDFYWTMIDGEFGLTELATLATLACAIYFAVAAFRHSLKSEFKVLSRWLVVILLGAIYFLGEEASWGQHIFEWETPEAWAEKNDQNETNLHNTDGIVGSLLDQLPRTGLTLSALILGFGYPLWRKMKDIAFSPRELRYWLLPTTSCVAVGLIAPLASVPEKIAGENIAVLDLAYGEIKELMLAQFILLYVLSLCVRLRAVYGQQRKPHVLSE